MLTTYRPLGRPMRPTMTTIGMRLRSARERSGWTQDFLASKARVPQPSVSRIESGDTAEPSGTTMIKLARALGVTVEWLYGL